MEMMTETELLPASLLHAGDWYIDHDGRKYLATVVTRSPNRWYVEVLRGDSTVRRYYISEQFRIFV